VVLIVVALLTCGVLLIFAATGSERAWLLAAVPVSAIVALVLWALFGGRRPASEVPVRAVRPHDPASRRVLVVADESCEPDDLRDPLARSAGPRVTEAFVVAPALASRLGRWTGDERAYEAARAHLETTLAALRELGIYARGHLGSSDPIEAADEALREFPADELVFATRGAGGNRLEADLLELARSRYRLPVSQIEITQPG
jgi:hypothetical protein